jgi:hypothetical protein
MAIGIIISIIPVIVAVIAIVVTYAQNEKLERARRSDDVCKCFRSAFSVATAKLGICRDDVHAIMRTEIESHDAAIDEFRRHIRRRKLTAFNAAVDNYRRIRDSNKPNISQYYHAVATGEPVKDHSSACSELLKAINELLEFAKPS